MSISNVLKTASIYYVTYYELIMTAKNMNNRQKGIEKAFFDIKNEGKSINRYSFLFQFFWSYISIQG